MNFADINKLAWQKMNGLIPAIIQDATNQTILMLGYMSKEALSKTLETGLVTFYSRRLQRLWTKGETSGNYLAFCDYRIDCDNDTILISAKPTGPTCHLGNDTCFNNAQASSFDIISKLENTIAKRQQERPTGSYVSALFNAGLSKISQKVGEEGVEVALAAVLKNKEQLCEEAADLFFHLLVLLRASDLSLKEVLTVLTERAKV